MLLEVQLLLQKTLPLPKRAFALKANATPTIANIENPDKITFFFILKVLFESKKLNFNVKISPTLF